MLMEGVAQISAMGLCGFGVWLFASAALQKLTDIPRFQATLGAYRIAPQRLTPALGLGVVVFEALAAMGLLLSLILPLASYPAINSSLLFVAAALAPVLLVGYAFAMGLNLRRGRRSIDCGCGGVPMPLSGQLVVRNLVLGLALLWALSVLALPTHPILGVMPLLLVFSCVLVLSLFYLITNQLFANSATRDRLWGQNQ